MKDMAEAAEALLHVLTQENDALRRMDLPVAAALVPAKQAAMSDLQDAPPVAMTPVLVGLGERLHAMALDNQDLLARAIQVQGQVIQIVASACKPPAGSTRYDRSGAPAAAAPSGLALSTRA